MVLLKLSKPGGLAALEFELRTATMEDMDELEAMLREDPAVGFFAIGSHNRRLFLKQSPGTCKFVLAKSGLINFLFLSLSLLLGNQ